MIRNRKREPIKMFDFEGTLKIMMGVLNTIAIMGIMRTATLARLDRIIIRQGFP